MNDLFMAAVAQLVRAIVVNDRSPQVIRQGCDGKYARKIMGEHSQGQGNDVYRYLSQVVSSTLSRIRSFNFPHVLTPHNDEAFRRFKALLTWWLSLAASHFRTMAHNKFTSYIARFLARLFQGVTPEVIAERVLEVAATLKLLLIVAAIASFLEVAGAFATSSSFAEMLPLISLFAVAKAVISAIVSVWQGVRLDTRSTLTKETEK